MDYHGKFGWNELIAPDIEAAKKFYAALLGWAYEGMTLPEGGTYWVASKDSVPCAGLVAAADIRPEQTEPFWLPYIMVDNVDASLAGVEVNGGSITRQAWDVPGIGRIGFCRDSNGAGFALMTPVPRA